MHTGRRWYLPAWDTARAGWRTFRADRIRPRTPGGPRFTPRRPPEDAATYVPRGVGSAAWRYPARVRLHAPRERLAELLPPTVGVLHEDGVLETGGESPHNVAAFLGTLGVPFTVLDSPGCATCCTSRPSASPAPDPPSRAGPGAAPAVGGAGACRCPGYGLAGAWPCLARRRTGFWRRARAME